MAVKHFYAFSFISTSTYWVTIKGPAPSQGLREIRTWKPVVSFKVLAALEKWQDHMDQWLVNRGDFTRNKEGGVRCQWRHSQRMRAVWRETGGREPWRADIYKDVWRRGGHSCRRTFKRHPSAIQSVRMSAWTTWGVVGGGLRCQVSVVIQRPLGRILTIITELVRSQGRMLRGIPKEVWREPRGVSRLEVHFWTLWESMEHACSMQWRCGCTAEERDWSLGWGIGVKQYRQQKEKAIRAGSPAGPNI